MRNFARWLGEVLGGERRDVGTVVLRVVTMFALSIGLMVLAVRLVHEEGVPSGPGRRPLWMGAVVLSVAFFFRALFELWELDGWLTAATFVAAVSGGFVSLCWQNLPTAGEALWPRMIASATLGLAATALAAWRIVVQWRLDRPRDDG